LVVVVLCRVTLIDELLSPEGEKAADDEANEADVDRKVDCEREDPVLAIEAREEFVGAGECSLIDPPLGGWIRLERDSHLLEWSAEVEDGASVATQGQTLGVTQLEVSL
jgi:hypothetical protein